MWLMVMFDLPVSTKAERKSATGFRNELLNFGFEICQFSVYVRFCEGREQSETWVRRIRAVLPEGGKVYCLFLTDKQYQGIVRFENRKALAELKNPSQFLLF